MPFAAFATASSRFARLFAGSVATIIVIGCGDATSPPRATRLVVTIPPTAAVQNAVAFPTQPTVQMVDSNDVAVGVAGVEITVAIASGGGALQGPTTATTASTGAATFGGLSLRGQVGPRTLTFSAPGVPSVSFEIMLLAGAAHSITSLVSENQVGVTGQPLPTPPAVIVKDADGNYVPGATVEFAITAGGGAVTAATATTNSSGVASVGWSPAFRGTASLLATVQGLIGTSATFTASVGAAFVALKTGFGGQTCALADDGAAFCWGHNGDGQLGDGTQTARTRPTLVAGGLTFQTAPEGFGHTCGVATSESIYCWGHNVFGQLGDGGTVTRLAPVAVASGLSFKSVTVGRYHTCALTTGGAAYCWGNNEHGQLGVGDSTVRKTPVAVAGGLTFQSLANGYIFTCGLTGDGSMYCWGNNGSGQFGDGSDSGSPTPKLGGSGLKFQSLATGYYAICGVAVSGTAHCWGNNSDGQVGDGTTITTAPYGRRVPTPIMPGVQVQSAGAGGYHSCGLTTEGTAFCWGFNGTGQVGDGTNARRLTPVAVSGTLSFKRLSAGDERTCGLTSIGIAYCWGSNRDGQLGDGTSSPDFPYGRSTPVQVRPP